MNAPQHSLEQDPDGRQRRSYRVSTKDDLRTALHHLHAIACQQFELERVVEVSLKEYNPVVVAQRAQLSRLCQDLSHQLNWHGKHLSEDDWRHLLVAAYRKDAREVEGLNGGLVLLGGSSRDLNKRELDDVLELARAFGVEHDVTFTERKTKPPSGTL